MSLDIHKGLSVSCVLHKCAVEYDLSNKEPFGRSAIEIYDYTKNTAMTIDEAFSLI